MAAHRTGAYHSNTNGELQEGFVLSLVPSRPPPAYTHGPPRDIESQPPPYPQAPVATPAHQAPRLPLTYLPGLPRRTIPPWRYCVAVILLAVLLGVTLLLVLGHFASKGKGESGSGDYHSTIVVAGDLTVHNVNYVAVPPIEPTQDGSCNCRPTLDSKTKESLELSNDA
ncbi:hypothetical protein AX16_009331 [Volvariella volvacea WC 439]|nr:hypothetical protein AX16_009331 [Volvariella volvacea WC 439]